MAAVRHLSFLGVDVAEKAADPRHSHYEEPLYVTRITDNPKVWT
jgi:hypothetical protein